MNPSTFIFLVQLMCFLVTIPICQCSSNQVFFPLDEKLVEETCRKTPDPDTCLFCLKSSGGSEIYTANLTRLADIMIDVVGLRVTSTLKKIDELLGKTPGDQPLKSCKDDYSKIMSEYVPDAKKVIYGSQHQIAGRVMHIPVVVGRSCEDSFKGSSPITDLNLGVIKVAGIAEAIIGQLG